MPLARHMLVAVSKRLYTLHKTRQHADYQANIDTLTRYTHACGIIKPAIVLY